MTAHLKAELHSLSPKFEMTPRKFFFSSFLIILFCCACEAKCSQHGFSFNPSSQPHAPEAMLPPSGVVWELPPPILNSSLPPGVETKFPYIFYLNIHSQRTKTTITTTPRPFCVKNSNKLSGKRRLYLTKFPLKCTDEEGESQQPHACLC